LKNRIKVQLETKQRREWKKTLRCRELQAVEAGFMVGGRTEMYVCSHFFLTMAGQSGFSTFRIQARRFRHRCSRDKKRVQIWGVAEVVIILGVAMVVDEEC